MKKIKVTKGLIKQLRPFWKKLQDLEDIFLREVAELEAKMAQETGIEGIEFFRGFDGWYAGVGNADRTMKLIHDHELEDLEGKEK